MPESLPDALRRDVFADSWFDPPPPRRRSKAAPGTPQRVRVLARRYARGVGLWHKGDVDNSVDDGSD